MLTLFTFTFTKWRVQGNIAHRLVTEVCSGNVSIFARWQQVLISERFKHKPVRSLSFLNGNILGILLIYSSLSFWQFSPLVVANQFTASHVTSRLHINKTFVVFEQICLSLTLISKPCIALQHATHLSGNSNLAAHPLASVATIKQLSVVANTPYSRRGHVQPYTRLGGQVRATLRKSWRNIIVSSRSCHVTSLFRHLLHDALFTNRVYTVVESKFELQNVLILIVCAIVNI